MAELIKNLYVDQLGAQALAEGAKAAAAEAERKAKEYAESLGELYDAAGSSATVQGNLDAEVLRAKAAEEANAAAAKKAQDEVDALELVVKNIQENAYDDTEIRGLISGLDTNKADKTQVATDIENAVKAETEAREEAVQGVQDDLDTFKGTYATDKAAIEKSVSDEASRAKGEEARIEGLVSAEAERAAGVEADLNERLEGVEAFFHLAEGEKLDEAKDTLIEIQKLIDEDAAAADQMVKDIAANKKAIEDHVATDHDFAGADAALKTELEGKIDLKADKTTVEGIDGRVKTAEEKLAEIEAKADVNVIETVKVNGVALTPDADKAVDVTVPTGALASKDKVAEADLETALAEKINAKADASALSEAVEALEGADADIVERIVELEKVDHSHANQAELDLIASGDKAKWDAAAGKAHEHANAEELAKVASGDVAKWNAAEQNAKDFATGLNNAMDTRMQAAEAGVAAVDGKVSAAKEEAISTAGTNADSKISAKVGAIDGTVKSYVDSAKSSAIETAGTNADTKIANAVGAIGDVTVKAYVDQAELDATNAAAADATSKANQALADAKAYTEEKIGDVDLSGIATNAAAISALEGTHNTDKAALEAADAAQVERLVALESVTYEAIPVATIQGYFA